MHAPFSHMNGRSHHEFNQWDPPFMWEEGARIYGTPGVHNNFPLEVGSWDNLYDRGLNNSYGTEVILSY